MQSQHRSRRARVAATSLCIAALAAPAASARPAVDPPAADHAAQRSPVVVTARSDNGFDWGSAGIGAAAGAGLVLVGVGSFAASYRGRVRLAR
jgi:hypothetical protein